MMRFFLILGLLICAVPQRAGAQETSLFEASGLPIPRFVSLRSDKVFVRTGPALRYPVKWIFQKQKLPVEVIQEFDTWRKIRDIEGDEGWVHQSLLIGERMVLIQSEGLVPLHREPGTESRRVAQIEPRVIAELEKCNQTWCRVKAHGYRGWVQRNFLWGIYGSEELD